YTSRLAGWGMEPFAPVVKYLIILNVIVFLLQIFVTRSPEAKEGKEAPQETLKKWQGEMQDKATELDEVRRDVAKTRLALKRAKGDQAEIDKLKADLKQKEADLKEKEEEVRSISEEWTKHYAEEIGFGSRASIVQEWLELAPDKVKRGEVWRLLTSAFCH